MGVGPTLFFRGIPDRGEEPETRTVIFPDLYRALRALSLITPVDLTNHRPLLP